MGIWVQKAIWALLQPSTLIALAMMIALWRMFGLEPMKARRWLAFALLGYLFAGATAASDYLLAPLERRFDRPSLAGVDVAGIVVLGGAEDVRVAGSRQIVAVNEAGERVIEAAILARQFPRARIILSGGSDPTAGAVEPESMSTARVLQVLGVERARLTLESASRTTWENAELSAPLMAQMPGETWLLVTSAWHMPRAVGNFRAVGVDVTPYPVDYRTPPEITPWQFSTHLGNGLQRFDTVCREYAGLLAAWLMGRSDALLPGPR